MKPFDLQVNGYGGVDFNQDDLTFAQLETACIALARDGVAGILATIITEQLPLMEQRIRRLVELRAISPVAQQLIWGLHIEGPFISPRDGYRGAHPLDAVRPSELDAMKRLLEAGRGLVRYVTLAPEHDASFAVTKYLAAQGIAIAAGHSDASFDQLRGAIDAGLTLYTHLGNGCPGQMARHDNIVQRVLSLREKLWITFIADGAHIPWFALRNYLDLAGERAVIVTDAIAPAGLGPGSYTLGRWDLQIGDDLVARSPDGSHLVGSALSMLGVIERLTRELNLSSKRIEQLISVNPRRALGIGEEAIA
jgi:N-acetylglucosamine-6-phosphate deacetylase